MSNNPDCLVLFSGGLDSLLVAKLMQKQGLNPLCLHFFSPFFGSPNEIRHWEEIHDLKIKPVDASHEFVTMLVNSPPHGSGKTLNPCIDCKIILLRLAHEIMLSTGARFIATGEVVGQRPMSQRPDAMHVIAKESGCQDKLLRPLCIKNCPPAAGGEISRMINFDELPSISGRGRNIQLQLAKDLGLSEIPTPAGGCRLTEIENSRRYWMVLERYRNKIGSQSISGLVQDFYLANLGRMFLDIDDGYRHWLCVGRNRSDNQKILTARNDCDTLLRLPFPGPLALCRYGTTWSDAKMREAAEILASYSTKAGSAPVEVREDGGLGRSFRALANKHEDAWGLPEWQTIRDELRASRRGKKISAFSNRNKTTSLHDKDVSATT